MKKAILHLMVFLLVSASCVAATSPITFYLDAGILADKNGSSIPDGSLILLLASPTGLGFSASVNEGSYVGGDAIIVADFALENVYGPGEAVKTLPNYLVESGYSFAIRWFPEVTYSDFINPLFSPTAGLYYGTYAGSTTGTPDGGSPWLATGASELYLNFFTTAIPGGTQPVSAGKATSQVKAVPEPSSVIFLTAGGALLAGAMVRRRKVA